ncbi:hypothetical protein BJ742DRAFT_771802 [Cladochytrium replicatum]|nr:hypothetical protein BJ742DRAFT_771802 [Cladochytrium replicatum]
MSKVFLRSGYLHENFDELVTHLIMLDLLRKNPEKKYLNTDTDIYPAIEGAWDQLLPGKQSWWGLAEQTVVDNPTVKSKRKTIYVAERGSEPKERAKKPRVAPSKEANVDEVKPPAPIVEEMKVETVAATLVTINLKVEKEGEPFLSTNDVKLEEDSRTFSESLRAEKEDMQNSTLSGSQELTSTTSAGIVDNQPNALYPFKGDDSNESLSSGSDSEFSSVDTPSETDSDLDNFGQSLPSDSNSEYESDVVQKTGSEKRNEVAGRKMGHAKREHLVQLSVDDEFKALERLEFAFDTPRCRFRRRLLLKRAARVAGNQQQFNLDTYVSKTLRNGVLNPTAMSSVPKLMIYTCDRKLKFKSEDLLGAKPKLSIAPCTTPFEKSFKWRMHIGGDSAGTAPSSIVSPFSGNRLHAYIWRDYESEPPFKGLLVDIAAIDETDRDRWKSVQEWPIDYVHFSKALVKPVNLLLSTVFWPGIDVSENLLWPEFSIVAMWRKIVVGCAFMTPDGYITYITVRHGWQNAGIARVMIYYLIQSVKDKDLTLHVSANNNAMLLYQKFGFKPEEFIVNFYDKYLPADSKACKNAFFVRLRKQ